MTLYWCNCRYIVETGSGYLYTFLPYWKYIEYFLLPDSSRQVVNKLGTMDRECIGCIII